MKKLLASVLAGCIAFSPLVLSGCKKDKDDKKDSSSATVKEKESATVKDKKDNK